MADIVIDRDRENVEYLVNQYGSDRWNESRGQIEKLTLEIENTRKILARLINAITDKRMFEEEEIANIIRGY